jgi:hypothetical protein
MTRTRRLVLVLLAGLMAVPTFLIAGAPAASASPHQPGPPPTLCVNDVERQFNSLKGHPEALGFHLGAGAYDPTSGRHYQGIVRIPGQGTPRFLTTRNGNVGPFELPGNDDQPGEVNIVELASRDTNGERVRSNRLVANESTRDTPPPAEDRVIRSLKAGQDYPLPSYRHLGGLQMWGDIAVIGMDRPFGTENIPGQVILLDVSDINDPIYVGGFTLDHQASSIGIAPFGDGRLLLITTGNDGSPIYGDEIYRDGKPTQDLRFIPFGPSPYLKHLFTYDAANKDVGWPTGYQSLQNTNLFTDCNTGEMYLMGGYNLAPTETFGRDRVAMWKIDPLTGALTPSSKRQVWCGYDEAGGLCSMGAASGFYVSPSGDLIMYGTPHDNDGPDGTVSMAEFSSQDGYDSDGAYRPVAVPGTYKAAVGAPITLDGTASTPAVAQGRVELFDDVKFGGRSLVVDYPDYGKEDYRHLGRVDDSNDEASSVRWRLPAQCQAVLYKDKDFTGASFVLAGGDGSAQAIENLKKFGDDTTSVRFNGQCDGRVVSWSWDLDNDGTVDGTGPKPTITPRTGGVHQLALTVCSGFGVCDKKVGTLDASAGTPPKTTAALTGTAGTNGWYRSTVNVNLTATGDPTPTEIRYSATGAGAMAERSVPGTTATVVVSAQGETVVHYRAVNSSGQEADKTVTVKVDTVAPTLTVRAPVEGARYVSGSAVTVQVDCADATSGVGSCTPNGTALDTAGTGARSVTATATDAAGNASPSKTVNYTLAGAPVVDADLVYVKSGDGSSGPVQRSNADGTNVIQIADRGDDPVWSPDGGKIAYTAAAGNGRQVFVTDADGTGTVAVTDSTTYQASSPAWSPDGSRIVYSGTWAEQLSPTQVVLHYALFTVPSTGGTPTTVASSDTTRFSDPTYSRNGASIAFVAGSDIRTIPATGVPAGQLGTVLIDGLGSGQDPIHPTWSADGTTLLFQVGERETFAGDVYVWKGAGDPVNITSDVTVWPPVNGLALPYEDGPTWLPDGRVIYTQDGDVYIQAAQHGAARVLLADLPWKVRNVDARGA